MKVKKNIEYVMKQETKEGENDKREHIDSCGRFQSDKYGWAQPDFVPLKVTDPMATDLLAEYAERRREVDEAFADDLLYRLSQKEKSIHWEITSEVNAREVRTTRVIEFAGDSWADVFGQVCAWSVEKDYVLIGVGIYDDDDARVICLTIDDYDGDV